MSAESEFVDAGGCETDGRSRLELIEDGICPTCRKDCSGRHGVIMHHSRSHGEPAITDGMLLAEIVRLRNELGRVPTRSYMSDCGKYSSRVYGKRFGGLNNALRKVGYEPPREKNIPEEDLLAEIHRLHDELGRVPTAQYMSNYGKYSPTTYKNRFSGWNNGLRKAGYEPNQVWSIPDEALLAEIDRLRDELGHVPSESDMSEYGKYSPEPYYNRFGSWTLALEAAGLTPRTPEDWVPSGEDHYFWNGGYDRYSGPNWNGPNGQRERAIERDDEQCVECGRTREEHIERWDEDLSVHHERPRTTFPFVDDEYNRDWEAVNALSNLVTCCKICHPELDAISRSMYPADEYPRHIRPEETDAETPAEAVQVDLLEFA